MTFFSPGELGFKPPPKYRCLQVPTSSSLFSQFILKKLGLASIDAFELWCWRRLFIPLDCKEIKPANPKGNQPWIFIGKTVAEVEAPILWPPDVKSRLIRKDPDPEKDWTQRRRVWQSMSRLESITNWMDMNLSKLRETVEDRGAWRAAIHDLENSWIWLSD